GHGAGAAADPPAPAGHANRLLADDRDHRDHLPAALFGENALPAGGKPRVGREASMRITPHDIRQQQFSSKMLKGYDPQEVDAFLDDVAEDYEALLKEAALLKEQIAAQEERARGVTERERTLQETLVTTQRLVEEMKNNARREAELILREAELTGEKSVEAARAARRDRDVGGGRDADRACDGAARRGPRQRGGGRAARDRARRAGLGGAGGPRRARPRQAGAGDGPEPRGNPKEARRAARWWG